MRLFVTGASGWIGSALIPELQANGHEVVGPARSDASAQKLRAAGAEVLRGSLDDLDSLRAGARDADGVVHLAYIHDFTRWEDSVPVDRAAIQAFGDELAGSDRPLVIASGTLGLQRSGATVTELDDPDTSTPLAARGVTAQQTRALAERGVRSVVVRLSPTVHGEGDQGFVAALVRIAREKGVAGWIGDGEQRWPAVHRADAARLFRLAVESGPAGSVWHAVQDEGIPIRTIAEVFARHLGVPAASIDPAVAAAHFGFLAGPLSLDDPTSSALTRERLGWTPAGPSLLEDLEAGHYFRQ